MNILSAFSGYSVDDLQKAKQFYSETLGAVVVEDQAMNALSVTVQNGPEIFLYQKSTHQPATFTVFNFIVEDIDSTVTELTRKGVIFERYEGFDQDESGIARSSDPSKGPNIAWFKDPAGNILSVLQN